MSKKFLLLGCVVVVLLIGANILLEKKSTPSTATVVNKGAVENDVAIGGDFEMTNHLGERVTNESYAGSYRLVFFGFTHCPDVCPTNLTHISTAMQMLGDDASKVVPIFVTVDPERDNAAVMKEYIAPFHPKMVGLTGTNGDVEAIKKAYKVYGRKMKMEWMADDEYLMDHSAFTYVMDKEGKYITHFTHNTDGETISKKLKEILS